MSQSSISMKGGGYYSKNTQGAKHVIDRAGENLKPKLSGIQLPGDQRPFAIVDYGAADGGTSLGLVTSIVQAIRQRSTNQEISVTYTDLPHNDFSSLFRMIHAQSPEDITYAGEFSNVFVLSAGTSFYNQIVASRSVDIGFSATAMHWLSGLPGTITDHVHAVGAHGREWEVFRDYAKNDWETILLHRARELVSGGVLLMANFCIDEKGRYLGNTGGANMFDTFNHLWRELADTGVISESEYQSTAFPQFYRTKEQYCEPFDDPESRVRAIGLCLEKAYTSVTKCPYRAEFDRVGDPVAFADAYVPTLRSWSETVFFGGLDNSRPMDERRKIVDTFYQNYNNLVRSEPELHAMDYVHTYMVVTKET